MECGPFQTCEQLWEKHSVDRVQSISAGERPSTKGWLAFMGWVIS